MSYRFSWLNKNQKCNNKSHQWKNNKFFQYSVTVTLNHEEIKTDPQRIKEIKAFVNKYNWNGINLPSEKNDWEKFEKNNVTIALNV